MSLFSSIFSLTLLLNLMMPTPSPGVSFNSAPARFWGYTYKSALNNLPTTTPQGSPRAMNEKKSEWRINFTNVPSDAKLAIQKAFDTWSENFSSKVLITVDVIWEREQNSSVLGSARPGFYFNAFPGAPDDDLWYPSALANTLAGKDLDPKQSEIILKLNSSVLWYTGTDGMPGKQSYDLSSVVLHEIGHGLGFLSNAEYDRFFGTGYMFQPTPYDAFVQLSDGRTFLDFCSRSADLGKAMIGDLYWSGSQGIAANYGNKPKLYTPTPYLDGSSITHLDESLFNKSPTDSLMTPNLQPGESLGQIGSIALGMIEDMLSAPPKGVAQDKPAKPLNVRALVGDEYALVTFESPNCRRIDQITGFTITVSPGGVSKNYQSSPARISGLKNGTSYTFTVRAVNEKGTSESVTSNSIKPESGGKSSIIDSRARVTYFASTLWRNLPTIVYSDELSGQLRIAIYRSSRWSITKIREGVKIGNISLCKDGSGVNETLHIVYSDLANKDIVHGYQLAKKWKFEIVDGNGESVQDYSEPSRRRTASDLSVSNACAITSDGLQVFYRDETQGILIGAVKNEAGWVYEIVDGDRKTDGHTTGDVAFHLVATSIGKKVYLFYDSVLTVNAANAPIEGEVRLAARQSIFPEDWRYETLDGPGNGSPVAGFSVAMEIIGKNIALSWLSSAGDNLPNADQVKFTTVNNMDLTGTVSPLTYGRPQAPLSIDNKGIVFGCEGRLCNASTSSASIKLAYGATSTGSGAIITIGNVRYAVSSMTGRLSTTKL